MPELLAEAVFMAFAVGAVFGFAIGLSVRRSGKCKTKRKTLPGK